MRLAVREPESAALRLYLRRRRPMVASALAPTQVLRALLPAGEDALELGRRILRTLVLVRVNVRILNAAGLLRPLELRSLDAIHLATAGELGSDLTALVTYDSRIAGAARALGYRSASPR